MQVALAEFPHTSLVTPNIAPFQSSGRYEIFNSPVLLLQHTVRKKRSKKKEPCMLSLHTFNFENLMIIGSNRTPAPQQEQLPLEPRMHLIT